MNMLPSADKHRYIDRTARTPQPAPIPAEYATGFEPDQPAAEPGGFQTLSSYLWRRKWTIAAAAMVGVALGLLASSLMKPDYRAHTSLQLEGFNPEALHNIPVSQSLPNASPEDYLQNEVKILESDTLASRVARQIGSPQAPASGPSILDRLNALIGLTPPPVEQNPDQARMESVKRAITVRTSLESQVIDVFFDAPTAELAAKGANAAATEFIAMNREARNDLVQDTTAWLNKQTDELRGRLEGANQKLQGFATRSGLVFDGAQSTPEQDRLRQLTEALTRAEGDRAMKQARYEAVIKNPADLLSDGLSNSPLKEYQTELQKLKGSLADLKAMYTPENPRVTRVEAQIADENAAIEKERQQIVGQLHNEYLAAASLEQTLSQSLTKSLNSAQHQSENERQYDVLKNDVQTAQLLYNTVLEKAKEAGAASSLRMTNVQVIDPALSPRNPYSPNLLLNMAVGFGFGTLGGIGLVLVGTRTAKVKQPGEMMFMRLPELGAVPSARGRELEAPVRGLALAGARKAEVQPSLLKESFRSVLTSILLSTRLERKANRPRGQVLVVSSMDMMEGKTTIVTNLGMASAERRREVLLIDADLRRPRLHERFHLPNQIGLTTLLERMEPVDAMDSAFMDSLVQPTQIPHLFIMTAGPTDHASPDRLYSANLDVLLRYLERRFDLILIDTPPLMMYSDARVLGRAAEGLVMVVRANKKSREELRMAYQKLVQDRIPVIGTILNDWNIESSQARAYNKYYNHYQQQSS